MEARKIWLRWCSTAAFSVQKRKIRLSQFRWLKTRDRRCCLLMVLSRKDLTHQHGAEEMIKNILKLSYLAVILKCDGESALKSIQEEVKRRRIEPIIRESSPVGDSRANGVAERAVQALVEHAADLLSKYQVGDDGRTSYERLKGKKCQHETVVSEEMIHFFCYNLKAKPKSEKLTVM